MGTRHGERTGSPNFTVVLRGYDRGQVDSYVNALMASDQPPARPDFSIVLRGYERAQVDRFVERVLAQLGPAQRLQDRES